jgi:hypothetical protein
MKLELKRLLKNAVKKRLVKRRLEMGATPTHEKKDAC